ncbi:rplA family protein [Pseudomonas amygdali pv. morsprunorum]|nr:rplA family protein [Pseudomonas amygdali pv. morsprunorum]
MQLWTLCVLFRACGAAQICDAERHPRHSYAGA